MNRSMQALIPSRPVSASPIPATYAVHVNGWMPVIHHPERTQFGQIQRFPRKMKATAAEAIEYARRVIHYRHIRAAAKRRKLEILGGRPC